MSKKPTAALSAGLVAVKGMAAPAADMPGRVAPAAALTTAPGNLSQPATAASTLEGEPTSPPQLGARGGDAGQPLNFRVPDAFRREFKTYAAQHGMKLNELLRRSFEALRRQSGN